MKTHHRTRTLTRSLAAVAAGTVLLSIGHAQNTAAATWGQAPFTRNAQPATALQPMSPQAEEFTLSRLAGRPLRSPSQEDLGTIADFLVEAQSGKVRFAVVPAGAGQGGETFRLVPIEAMDSNADGEAFTSRIDRAKWDQVGTRTAEQTQARVTLSVEEQQRLADQYALGNQPGFNDNRATLELVRASSLRGQPVRAGNAQLGTIADVAIDIRHQAAAAVLAPNGNFPGAQKVFVPFDRLQLSEQTQGGVMTTLTRQDFQQAFGAPAPTGYNAYNPAGRPFTPVAQQPVTTHAAAVQQALARNQALNARVQVMPESRLVLRGSVPNQQLKAQAEQAAAQAAPGVQIESQITVQGW